MSSLQKFIKKSDLVVTDDDWRLVEEGTFDQILVSGYVATGLMAKNMALKSVWLEKCQMQSGVWEKLQTMEVMWEQCDVSNTKMYESNWWKVKMVNCKLVGTHVNASILENVEFDSVKAEYLQVRYGKLRNVVFKDSDLKMADFSNSDLSGCVLKNCDLQEAEFYGAKLVGTDLRGSNLDKIKLSVVEIKGAIVTSVQAMYLMNLLGVEVRD